MRQSVSPYPQQSGLLLETLPRRPSPVAGRTMILIEKFLLPPNLDDAQRQAIVSKRVHKRRASGGYIIAVFPGEDGWVRQLGNANGVVYFGVIERQCSPSLPRLNQRRKSC